MGPFNLPHGAVVGEHGEGNPCQAKLHGKISTAPLSFIEV